LDAPKPFFKPDHLKFAFLVWGPPSQGPRSKVLARELGIEGPHYIYSTTLRGSFSAPFKYAYQGFKTLRLLFQQCPKIVFVQSPPSFAVLFVFFYCRLTGAKYIVDAHSAALQLRIWTWPKWLCRLLARKAVTTIVTNEHFQKKVQGWGGHAFVLRDIPTCFIKEGDYPMIGDFNLVVVNTFSADEPLKEVVEAADTLPEVQFYVTGRKGMAPPEILSRTPANVHFTDFLPEESYYALLNTAHAVICLTNRDHTMQRGACEALSLGKPIITSAWPLLRSYFCKGTVHVPNTSEGIRQGVLTMKEHYPSYEIEIKELLAEQRLEWREKRWMLTRLIEQYVELD
jgi:glycosyltransferase involved in cell wall biosynthesis